MKSSSKIRIMENFISVDFVCFGERLKDFRPNTDTHINEFMELKGALCSVLSEIYDLVSFDPKMPERKITTKELIESARDNAITARKNSKIILESDYGKKSLGLTMGENVEMFHEHSTEEIVDFTIHQKSLQVALDNLLIARMMNESEKIDSLQSFNGIVLEDAYKSIRDTIVEKAIEIIEN